MELVRATPEQQRARDPLTHPAWGGKLSVEQYLERELMLRAHPWAAANLIPYLLVDGSQVLASCEAFRMESLLDGVLGNSFAIASVFTEPALRGRGHALKMMTKVVADLKQQSGAQSSVLYSEVGPKIYERAGYQLVPGTDLVLPPLDAPLPAGVTPFVAPVPRPNRPSGNELVLWPTADQLDWHLERSRLYGRFLKRTPLQADGASFADARAWFAAYFKSDELLVLWLEGSPEGLHPLLKAAQVFAHRAGLGRVRLWNDPELKLTAADTGAVQASRDDELPMVAWLSHPSRWRQIQRALWV